MEQTIGQEKSYFSVNSHMIEKDKLLEFTTSEDPFLDFCLWEYQPNTSFAHKLRSVNLLFHTFEIAGADDLMLELCNSIRNSIGDWRTVWGVKQIGNNLSWEFYFYDYNRVGRTVSLSKLCDVLQEYTKCDLRINEDFLYFMFSIDLDNALVTGQRELDEINVYIGNIGSTVSAGICYSLTKAGMGLDNLYYFFDGRNELQEITDKITCSAHVQLSMLDLNSILIPELKECKTIVVANKKQNDGIYYSRINIDQFLFFLGKMEYPSELINFVNDNKSSLDHLLYDVGIDYKMKDGNLELLKSSFYGVF